MATTNLFWRPVFKEGAFTANDPAVRRLRRHEDARRDRPRRRARRRGVRDVGRARGRRGRRGQGRPPGARPLQGGRRPRAASTSATAATTCASRSSPSPTSPAATSSCPTVGHALAFIGALEWPDMVGLNPEFAHETMSGLSFSQAVAQTLWHGKLFHIDLNAQRIGKFDQDFRFGSEGIRDAFYVVKLLEDAGWDGMRHFDAHAYRTEDADGVWDFARGLHAHLPDPGRQGAAVPRRRRDPGGAAGRHGRPSWPSRPLPTADSTRSCAARTTRMARRAGLRPRAARPARDRTAARRPLSAPGGRGRLVHDSLQGPGARRRHRRRSWRPAVPRTRRRPRRAASSTRGIGRRRSTPACAEAGVPAATRRRPLRLRPAARDGRARRRRRGPAARQAVERHRVGARRRDARGRPAGRPGRLGAAVRERPGRRASRSPSCSGCAAASPRRRAHWRAVLLPHDWLTFRLTGRRTTDRGDASGTGYWSPARGALPRRPAASWSTTTVDWAGAAARGARARTPSPGSGPATGAIGGPGTGDNMAAALGLGPPARATSL